MQARILFLTDLHKRDTDFTTVVGYTQAIDAVQEDILSFIARNKVTHVVIGGDWYDKGYRNINRTFNDVNYDKLLSDSVNGNVYICRGNHLYLERDSNPEMYLIQPCAAMPPIHPIKLPETSVFQSPDTIQIGPLQISLFHFSKENKCYRAERNPETTFHIGVYHDDVMLPSSVRNLYGDKGLTSSYDLQYYFDNIDLGVCNHIHTAIGQVKIPLVTKSIPVFIPGSLCITKNQASELHDHVELPVITLEDDNTVRVSLANFSLHLEMLKLYKKKEVTKELFDNAPQAGFNSKSEVLSALAFKGNQSLKDALMEKGYTSADLQLVEEAYASEVSTSRILSIYKGGDIT